MAPRGNHILPPPPGSVRTWRELPPEKGDAVGLQGRSSGNMDTHPALGLVAWVREGFAFTFFPEGLSQRRWKPGERADSGQKLKMPRDSRA